MQLKHSKKFTVDFLEWKIAIMIGSAIAIILVLICSLDWIRLLSDPQSVSGSFAFRLPGIELITVLFLACIVAGCVAAVLHPLMFWTALALLMGAVLVMGLSFYSFKGVKMVWLMPGFGVFCSGTIVFCIKELKRRESLYKLTTSLERYLSPKSLGHIKSRPQLLNITDRQVPLSVLAIEVVGLKETFEAFGPEEVFPKVRELYNRITKSVHANGGIMIPGYRDGFLCIFGDTFFDGQMIPRHAEAALQTALKIQKDNALVIRMNMGRKEPIFVLRCGVASSRAYLLNLGYTENLEFNLFGDIAEDARSYQKACDMGSILFSRMTRDLLVGVDPNNESFRKKLINIRGSSDEITEVYEFDPLNDAPGLRAEIFQVIKESAKYERKDPRWPIMQPDIIELTTNIGPAEIVNISRGGLGVKIAANVTNGTTLRVKIDSSNFDFKKRLQNRAFSSFGAEVRWSTPKGTFFLTGLTYKNVAEADKDFLLQCILETQDGNKKKKPASAG